MAESWSSDVPISMPEGLQPGAPGLVSMFGFTFTQNGINHDLTPSEREELATPTWAPLNPRGIEVRGDQDFKYGLGS